MNIFERMWLDRKLKRGLARNHCRLDSGIRGLRGGGTLVLEHGVKLHDVKVYAEHLHIGAYTDIVSGTELHQVSHIGRYCSIAAKVILGHDRRSHPLDWLSTSHAVVGARLKQNPAAYSPDPGLATRLGHDVWIGRDVMVMKGVTIGTGAVVGAQSLVNKDVPPYAIVAGSPARVVRYRFSEPICHALLDSRWWECDLNILAGLSIESPEAFLERLQGQPEPRAINVKTVVLATRPLRIKPCAADLEH